MSDLAVSNDTEIIAEVQKTAEILMIFKVHTHGEQTVVLHFLAILLFRFVAWLNIANILSFQFLDLK